MLSVLSDCNKGHWAIFSENLSGEVVYVNESRKITNSKPPWTNKSQLYMAQAAMRNLRERLQQRVTNNGGLDRSIYSNMIGIVFS